MHQDPDVQSQSHPTEFRPRSESYVLRKIVERVPEGLVVIDDQHRFLVFNPAAKRILGLREFDSLKWVEDLGLSSLDGKPLQPEQSPLSRALCGESVTDYKMQVSNRQMGRRIVISVNAEPLPAQSGGGQNGALATFRDLSADYRTADLDDPVIAAVEYRQLVDALHEGLWTCDEAGTTLFVNEKVAAMLGHERCEMIGHPIFEFFPEERIDTCHEHLARRRRGITEDYETELVGKDGRRVFVIIQASPLYDQKKRFRGSLAGVVDITHRHDAECALESEYEQLEGLVRERTAKLQLALEEVHRLKEQLESENVTLREELASSSEARGIVGSSETLRAVLEQVTQVAPTETSVLLFGETGTGKGLLAETIHHCSHLSKRPFVTVDCASLPSSLIESELFGHEKGAFTSADSARAGRFEVADGGTLFLDEIGDLPLDAQSRLLRFLHSGEFERLGSTKTRRVRVRIIGATNRNLEEMVTEGRFRSDLFYRLNVFPIRVPALRDRLDDVPELVRHFVGRNRLAVKRGTGGVAPEVFDLLSRYTWPGNIRELENVVERSLILARGRRIEPSHLRGALAAGFSAKIQPSPDDAQALPVSVRDNERRFLLDTLKRSNWKIKGPGNAAERAGLAPSTLRDRMAKLSIRRPAEKTEGTDPRSNEPRPI
jgi:PAS domain S-box-containing protein